MNLFLLTFFDFNTTEEGFMVVKGKSYEDIKCKLKEKYNDRYYFTGAKKCDKLDKSNFQVIYSFSTGE